VNARRRRQDLLVWLRLLPSLIDADHRFGKRIWKFERDHPTLADIDQQRGPKAGEACACAMANPGIDHSGGAFMVKLIRGCHSE
jgi:hypothetical protein